MGTREVDNLKPCPFCHGRQLRVWHLSRTIRVHCVRCLCSGPEIEVDWIHDAYGAEADAEAIEAWQLRPTVRTTHTLVRS